MPFGVTPAMLDAFGDVIFDLSLNRQVRKGDPVRTLDVVAWQAQRDASGRSDPEIAATVGLEVEQVTFIRNIVERRRFRLDQYRKLFRLGAGRRHDAARYQDPEARLAARPEALRLRAAMAFDPKMVSKYIDAGWWTGEVLGDWLARAAASDPTRPAVVFPGGALDYGALAGRAAAAAASLRQCGLEHGDVLPLSVGDAVEFLTRYLGAAALGVVVQPLAADLPDRGLGGDRLRQSGAPTVVRGAVAADPLLLLAAAPGLLAPLSHQNVLATARLTAQHLGITADDSILSTAALADPLGLLAFHLALSAGAALMLPGAGPAAPTVRLLEHDADDAGAGRLAARLWGMAETQAVVAGGHALPGVELRLVGGALQLRGCGLMPGYFDNPAANTAAFTADGWFRSGRRAVVDQTGLVAFNS